MKIKRGNELALHRALKNAAKAYAHALGFPLVIFECCSDVLAMRRVGQRFERLAIEVQLSTKHVVQNIVRDLSSGANSVVIVTPTESLATRIRSLINEKLSEYLKDRVTVLSASALSQSPVKKTSHQLRKPQSIQN
jgi:hypothetical protein